MKMSSTSTSASASTPQENEITTLIPDKEKLFSDLKAFTSHHEMTTALEGKKLKEKEKELEKATVEIEKLHTEIAEWKNEAEDQRRENAAQRKHSNQLNAKLLTEEQKNYQLEIILKAERDKISRLEQDVKKLSEINMSNQQYKQKVDLATQIFRSPIRNVRINHQNNETHFAIGGPLNEESTNGNRNENGAGKSEPKYSTRGVPKAKRGRPCK